MFFAVGTIKDILGDGSSKVYNAIISSDEASKPNVTLEPCGSEAHCVSDVPSCWHCLFRRRSSNSDDILQSINFHRLPVEKLKAHEWKNCFTIVGSFVYIVLLKQNFFYAGFFYQFTIRESMGVVFSLGGARNKDK
ncbi:hypothetical protein QVD17_15718 [Tagetes erecta]|uniref:Uncharacterized protein n=1 Tax=Tagetes erecta TaxID=13708 RepID=A0AAD8NZX1_TARER|nr:hypothetical protein QVD17_15718 [Tagetes erecta]